MTRRKSRRQERVRERAIERDGARDELDDAGHSATGRRGSAPVDGVPGGSRLERTEWLVIAGVIAAVAIAFAFRTIPPYPAILGGERVMFSGNDSWIHMRNVDNAAAHLPLPQYFDRYRLPEGQYAEAPLMDIAIAAIASAFSGGRATERALDLTGAWFPAVLGALTTIPIFFLTRRLYGTAAGIIAALLVAVMPNELTRRSLLGETDHHVVEAFFAILVLLFLVRSLERETTRSAARDGVIAGVLLGIYLLSWARGAFFLLILLVWALVQIIVDRFWEVPRLRTGTAIGCSFGVALLFVLPVAPNLPGMSLAPALLMIGALGVAGCDRLAAILTRRGFPLVRIAVTLAMSAVAVAGLVMITAVLIPRVGEELIPQMRRFFPQGGAETVVEVRPLLKAAGTWSLQPLWHEYRLAGPFALFGIVALIRSAFARRNSGALLFASWAIATTAATLAQTRFGYYMAIGVAVIAAGMAARLLWHRFHPAVAAILIGLVLFAPGVHDSWNEARSELRVPRRGWMEVLEFMRMRTPEPFDDPNEYFARRFGPGDSRAPKYAVLAWWDFGYLITRVGRRTPVTNPTQANAYKAARFFTSTDEKDAARIMGELNARYVIADDSFPVEVATYGQPGRALFDPMARWARTNPSRWYRSVYQESNGEAVRVFVYKPDYYRAMATRLSLGWERGYMPQESTWCIRTRRAQIGGQQRELIIAQRFFPTYPEALNFLRAEPDKGWELVGRNPFRSPVPILPLRYLRGIRQSRAMTTFEQGTMRQVSLYELRQ